MRQSLSLGAEPPSATKQAGRKTSTPRITLDLKRRYAETFYDRWLIVSAEHGFIPPWKEIEPYETHIDDRNLDEFVSQLAHGRFCSIRSPFVTLEFGSEIDVLAGKKYCNAIQEAARKHDKMEKELHENTESDPDLVAPALGFPFQEANLSGFGKQMSWLKTALEDHVRRPPEGKYQTQVSLDRYSILG